jgi:hypothetical protein
MSESATRWQAANGNLLLARIGHLSIVGCETGIGAMQSRGKEGMCLAVDGKVVEHK